MTHYMIDKDGKITTTEDALEWAKWMEESDDIRRIGYDEFPDNVRVSTVFLGLDHNFYRNSEPILFETMIFGGKHDQYQDRYYSRAEAILGHKIAVDMVTKDLLK